MQLPLGRALDRYGPRRTLLVLLARGGARLRRPSRWPTRLPGLIAARVLIGAGVGACLMAPLTCYRRLYTPRGATARQLLDADDGLAGHAGVDAAGAVAAAACSAGAACSGPWRRCWRWRWSAWRWLVPADPRRAGADAPRGRRIGRPARAGQLPQHRSPPAVRAHRRRSGFFLYGGLIAVQSLWAGPWLTRSAAGAPTQAAQGLLLVNLAMLFAFMAWGVVMPRLVRRGIGAVQTDDLGPAAARCCCCSCNVALGGAARRRALGRCGAWPAPSSRSASRPSGQAFPAALAGRALSAFNLVIFAGVFCMQWGIGLLIDALRGSGWREADAFRLAFAAFGLCCVAAYVWFLRAGRAGADNPD